MGNIPVFNARFVANTAFDKLYRIYIVGDQLFFIRIGGQGGVVEVLTHQLGLVGLLLQSPLRKRAERKVKALVEVIDGTNPEQLLARHKDNFRLGVVEVLESTVDPPSFLATHGPHVGRWQLNLRDGRKLTFQLEIIEEMRIALDVLRALFVSGFHVNVRWNEEKKTFEKREDAA